MKFDLQQLLRRFRPSHTFVGSGMLLFFVFFGHRLSAQERETGFYPTLGEAQMIGAGSKMMYRRGIGGLNIGGPDASSLTASGLWAPDREPYDNFYERNSGFFDPLDSTLGLLAPNELVLLEGDYPRNDRLYGYGDLGFPLTRNFNPDLATFRLGPVFLDILSIRMARVG